MKTFVAGHYDMTCAEIPGLYSYWELRADSHALQDGAHMGTWNVKEGIVVITYLNPAFGHAVLSWDGPGVLVGENRWRDGGQFTWRMIQVIP